jgi:hypothetical protein
MEWEQIDKVTEPERGNLTNLIHHLELLSQNLLHHPDRRDPQWLIRRLGDVLPDQH